MESLLSLLRVFVLQPDYEQGSPHTIHNHFQLQIATFPVTRKCSSMFYGSHSLLELFYTTLLAPNSVNQPEFGNCCEKITARQMLSECIHIESTFCYAMHHRNWYLYILDNHFSNICCCCCSLALDFFAHFNAFYLHKRIGAMFKSLLLNITHANTIVGSN